MRKLIVALVLAPSLAFGWTWKVETVSVKFGANGAPDVRNTTNEKWWRPGKYPLDAPPGWMCTLKIGQIEQLGSTVFRQFAWIECSRGDERVSTEAMAVSGGALPTTSDVDLTIEAGGRQVFFRVQTEGN